MKKIDYRPAVFEATAGRLENKKNISIFSLLGEGEENGLKARELANITGLSAREVQRKVRQERLRGALIISTSRYGFFRPANGSDIVRYRRSLRHRAAEIFKLERAVEIALSQMDGQYLVEGW